MQKLFKFLIKDSLLFILTMVLINSFSGCKSNSNPTGVDNNNGGTNTVTLNGDGWSNSSLTSITSTCTYSISENVTVISISNTEGVSILMYIKGNKTGTFDFGDPNSNTPIGITMTSSSGQDVKYYAGIQNSGTITVSSYGTVGGKVSGSFNGKIYNGVTQAELTISGSFSAIRTVDIP